MLNVSASKEWVASSKNMVPLVSYSQKLYFYGICFPMKFESQILDLLTFQSLS